jgi:hypothetical protein
MCWFHVRYNIRKKRALIGQDNLSRVNNDILKLHLSQNETEFHDNWNIIKTNWSKISSLNKFLKYFTKQWINSDFNKWSIYHTPIGYCTTNSSLERYNRE